MVATSYSRQEGSARGRSGDWPRIPQAAPEPTRVPGMEGAGQYLAVSGAGPFMRLVYERYTSDYDIWRMDLPLADHATRLIASTRSENSASYSPDAKRIVFASARSGMNEIWVCDADGGNAVQLTSLGTYAGSPKWSPDGLRITFDALNADNRDIYVIAAEGGSPRRMTTEPSEESRPSWSNDGRWIYFTSNRSGSRQIWKMPSEGGSATQVTKLGGYEPRESPAGKLLYYIKDRSAPGLRSIPVGGGTKSRYFESLVGQLGTHRARRLLHRFLDSSGQRDQTTSEVLQFPDASGDGGGDARLSSGTRHRTRILREPERALGSARSGPRDSDLILWRI